MKNYLFKLVRSKFQKKKARCERKKRLKVLLALKEVEFNQDPNNRLDMVERCYADNRIKTIDDSGIIKRIIKAYKRAKTVQKMMPSYYQVSNEWLPIYEKHLKEVMLALESEDVGELQRIYQNFMRDPCSTGLVGLPVNMEKYYFGKVIKRKYKKLHLYSTLHRMKLWKNLLGTTHTLNDLSSPRIGNPYYYYIDGVFIKAGSDYQHYYATAIGRLTRSDNHRTIVEIGGGYGGMAYYLVRDHVNLTYIDFDLPENMALTAYYLLNAFPEKKTVLFGEAELTPQCIMKNEIIIMPNFEIDKLRDNSVDLVFNSYSLAEMSAETISNYISHITRSVNRYFFHVNHTKHSLVTADNFGIDPNRFDLIYKVPALWNAGVNMDMDEFEYLYNKIGS